MDARRCAPRSAIGSCPVGRITSSPTAGSSGRVSGRTLRSSRGDAPKSNGDKPITHQQIADAASGPGFGSWCASSSVADRTFSVYGMPLDRLGRPTVTPSVSQTAACYSRFSIGKGHVDWGFSAPAGPTMSAASCFDARIRDAGGPRTHVVQWGRRCSGGCRAPATRLAHHAGARPSRARANRRSLRHCRE